MKRCPLGAIAVAVLILSFSGAHALTPAHLWSQRFGGTGDDSGRVVAVDGTGNVLVTGTFTGTVNFGGGDLTSAGGYDIFVAKYDSASTSHGSSTTEPRDQGSW
jgi:hypothetical protein